MLRPLKALRRHLIFSLMLPSRIQSRSFIRCCRRVALFRGYRYALLGAGIAIGIIAVSCRLILDALGHELPLGPLLRLQWYLEFFPLGMLLLFVPIPLGYRSVPHADEVALEIESRHLASVHLKSDFVPPTDGKFHERFASVQHQVSVAVDYCRMHGFREVEIRSWLYLRKRLDVYGKPRVRSVLLNRDKERFAELVPGARVQIMSPEVVNWAKAIQLRAMFPNVYRDAPKLGFRPYMCGLKIWLPLTANQVEPLGPD